MKTRAQRGSTIFVVLILMTVMLLGGLIMARMSEIGTLISGNLAYKEAALQASEVGINTAFEQTRALTNEEANLGNWYWAVQQPRTADDLPNINWTTAPELTVGQYQVRYVVERLCEGALPVSDEAVQCLLRQMPLKGSSAKVGAEPIDPPAARQFRITVRVTGPKDTRTWVQSLVTRGLT